MSVITVSACLNIQPRLYSEKGTAIINLVLTANNKLEYYSDCNVSSTSNLQDNVQELVRGSFMEHENMQRQQDGQQLYYISEA